MTKLKLGMIGGGQGAFIGGVHRIASRIDDHYELVAGSLASKPDIAHASAKDLGISEDRSYSSYEEMSEKESNRDLQEMITLGLSKYIVGHSLKIQTDFSLINETDQFSNETSQEYMFRFQVEMAF